MREKKNWLVIVRFRDIKDVTYITFFVNGTKERCFFPTQIEITVSQDIISCSNFLALLSFVNQSEALNNLQYLLRM